VEEKKFLCTAAAMQFVDDFLRERERERKRYAGYLPDMTKGRNRSFFHTIYTYIGLVQTYTKGSVTVADIRADACC
jgi:hypothetical protein